MSPIAKAAAVPVMEPNPQIATRYDYPSIARPGLDFPKDDPNSRSITNQSDKDSTDINKIMERYEKTGLVTVNGVERKPIFGDFSNVGDFHQLQNTLAKVKQSFAVLPAAVRSKFDNDPAKLIDFLADPNNDDEALKLGLKTTSEALTAVADDGKTKITQDARAALDAAAAAKKAADAAASAAAKPVGAAA